VTQLTPEELNTLLGRLTEVETEARVLREQIEARLIERRRADAQDRSGQPKSRMRKRTRRK
jgi:hypothetical protein